MLDSTGPISRAATTSARHARILEVAVTVLAQHPDASMEEIAAAAGVVRRTVYAHFPSREELIYELVAAAAHDVRAVLDTATSEPGDPATQWRHFVELLWPAAGQYRTLLAVRRTAYSARAHALLEPITRDLTALIARGQRQAAFTRELPAPLLAQAVQAVLFTIAEASPPADGSTAVAASSLMLGVRSRGVPHRVAADATGSARPDAAGGTPPSAA